MGAGARPALGGEMFAPTARHRQAAARLHHGSQSPGRHTNRYNAQTPFVQLQERPPPRPPAIVLATEDGDVVAGEPPMVWVPPLGVGPSLPASARLNERPPPSNR